MLTVLSLLLKLAQGISVYLSQRQLLDAGRALQLKEDLEDALQITVNAQRIRRHQRTNDDADFLRPKDERNADE